MRSDATTPWDARARKPYAPDEIVELGRADGHERKPPPSSLALLLLPRSSLMRRG